MEYTDEDKKANSVIRKRINPYRNKYVLCTKSFIYEPFMISFSSINKPEFIEGKYYYLHKVYIDVKIYGKYSSLLPRRMNVSMEHESEQEFYISMDTSIFFEHFKLETLKELRDRKINNILK